MLAGVLNGHTLDLSGLASQDSDALAAQAETLMAGYLDYAGRSSGASPLTHVVLPHGLDAPGFRKCLAAFARLPACATLEVPASQGALIDLGALRPGAGLTVMIDCSRGGPSRVQVPLGADVVATRVDAGRHYLHKPRVEYVDAEGAARESRTLAGLPYFRQSREADHKKAEVVEIKLNGSAAFEDGNPIFCRHLAPKWIQDRKSHRDSKPDGGVVPFSYQDYLDRPKIEAQFAGRRMIEVERSNRRSVRAVFAVTEFPTVLLNEFQDMRPGDRRHFTLESNVHVMGLELLVKDASSPSRTPAGPIREVQYVINLYDPNTTATHRRMVLTDDGQIPLACLSNFLGETAMRLYFGDSGDQLGVLCQPDDAPYTLLPSRREYGLDGLTASANYLCCALQEGFLDMVEKSLTAIFALPPERAVTALRALPEDSMPSGLGRALANDCHEVVRAYVRAILGAPDELLSPIQRHHVLTGQFRNGSQNCAGDLACAYGGRKAYAAFLEMLIDAPAGVMAAQVRIELLHGSDFQTGGHLARLCAREWDRDPVTDEWQTRIGMIYDTARLFSASSRLTDAEKMALLDTRMVPEEQSKPQLTMALKKNELEVVAAFVCGVLDGEPDQTKARELLDSAGLLNGARQRFIQIVSNPSDAIKGPIGPWCLRLSENLERLQAATASP